MSDLPFQAVIVQAENCIRVWNNGDGVPVEIHKEENVYVPELIFGHLLTSSNYNDDEQKVCKQGCLAHVCVAHCFESDVYNVHAQVTGGRNGYGAKLTNIFSTEFTVETCDGQRSRRYKQVSCKPYLAAVQLRCVLDCHTCVSHDSYRPCHPVVTG